MDQWPESPSNARKLYKCVSTQLYPLCLNVSYKWPMAQFHPNACKVYNTNWNALFYPCDATVRLTLLSRILLKTHKLNVYSITLHVCPDILTGKHAVVVDLLAAKQWSEHHTYSPPPHENPKSRTSRQWSRIPSFHNEGYTIVPIQTSEKQNVINAGVTPYMYFSVIKPLASVITWTCSRANGLRNGCETGLLLAATIIASDSI